MIRAGGVALLAAVVTCGSPSAARAQEAPAGRLEFGAGLIWIGKATLGSSDATETTGTGSTARIFSSSSVLEGAVGVGAHIGVRLARRFELSGVAAFSKPTIRTTISSDIEASETVTAAEQIKQYQFGGELLYYLPANRGRRVHPFVAGGVAYLRQLHESDTLAVSGRTYQLGGGLKYLFGSAGRRLKSYGVHADAAVEARSKGVAFDGGTLYSPSLGIALFARF